MVYFYFYYIIATLLISCSFSKSTNFDKKRNLFFVYDGDLSKSSDSKLIEHEIVKRQTSETNSSDIILTENIMDDEPMFNLNDIVHHVEQMLVKSALSVSAAVKSIHNSTYDKSDNNDTIKIEPTEIRNSTTTPTTEHSLRKRYALDLEKQEEPKSSSTVHMNSRQIEATEGHPAHIAIDRVVVYVAEPKYFPAISTFDLPLSYNDHKGSALKRSTIVETVKNDVTKIQTDQITVSPFKGTTINVSTTPLTTSYDSTTNSLMKLKNTEKELKTKVAEIEADPVILSTRV